MITNRWKPDTCECVLEYEFDADAPEDQRIHTPKAAGQKCVFHASLPNHVAHYDGILAENRKKNIALQALIESLPASEMIEEQDFEGNVKRRPKFEPKFSFDADRKLKFTVHASAKPHLAKLNNDVKAKFADVDVE